MTNQTTFGANLNTLTHAHFMNHANKHSNGYTFKRNYLGYAIACVSNADNIVLFGVAK